MVRLCLQLTQLVPCQPALLTILSHSCYGNSQRVWTWFKWNSGCLHELSEHLFLVDLVAYVVNVGGEVVLGMVVYYITNVREHHVLKYAVLQVFQESVESDNKFSELAENCAQACWTIKNKLYIPVPVSSSTSDLAALHIINHFGVSVFSLSPFTLFFPHLSLTSRILRMLEKRVFLSLMIIVSSSSRLSMKCSVRTWRDRK